MAASMGKAKKGDAIIIRQGSEFGVGKITGMKNDPSVFTYNQTTALVIRWLTSQEIVEADSEADPSHSPFYSDPRTHLMDQEIAAFEAMKTELIANHLGQYAAVFHGALVDHDAGSHQPGAQCAAERPDDSRAEAGHRALLR